MKWLTLLIKALSLIAGAGAYAEVIPAKYGALAALAFMGASSLKDLLINVGDYLDNKTLDGSFKP